MEIKLILGYKCNLSCSYCYQAKDRCCEEMNQATLDKFIERFNKLEGDNHINFFGGEPLLYLDKIKYVLDRINKNTTISITTNGSLRKEFYELQDYVEYEIPNLLSNKEHKNYNKLNKLSAFRYIVTKENINELTDELIEFLAYEYKNNLQFKYDMSKKWELEDIQKLEKINKKLKSIIGNDYNIELPVNYNAHFGCFVSGTTCFIDSNGNYLACHRNRKSVIGNIFDDEFKTMNNKTCLDINCNVDKLYSYGNYEFKGITLFHSCD